MAKKKSGIHTRKKAVHREKQRRQRLLWGGIVVVLLLLAAFALRQQSGGGESAADGSRTAPEVGAVAPDFELVSYEGETMRLSDFRGRPVAVMFMHTW